MNIRAIFTVDRVVSGYTPPQPVISSHLKQNLTANDTNAIVAPVAVTQAGILAGQVISRQAELYSPSPADYTPSELEPATSEPWNGIGPWPDPPPPSPSALQPGEIAMHCGDGRTLIGTLTFQVRNPELTPSGMLAGAVHYFDIALND